MAQFTTTAQIKEFLEVEAKMGGAGEHFQELISRLTSGGIAGKTDDIRLAQAKRLYDLGVGRELGARSFKEYLEGFEGADGVHWGIPAIPEALLADSAEFPLLVLVDPRVRLKKLCNLAGVAFDGDDNTFEAYDKRHEEFTKPTWIRIQDGRKNKNRSVNDCRRTFAKCEIGLTALQGVFAYIHHPTVLSEATQDGAHIMDLSGSVHRRNRGNSAYLLLWEGRPRLGWDWDDGANPRFGSASRGECQVL